LPHLYAFVRPRPACLSTQTARGGVRLHSILEMFDGYDGHSCTVQ
jgi:hypothetical protein